MVIFRINNWRIEPEINSIHFEEQKIVIGPTPMKLLLELIRHQGEVVSKESLYTTVWDGVVVNEETIRKTISTLRQHFTVDQRTGIDIETIRSVGYRLLSKVDVVSVKSNRSVVNKIRTNSNSIYVFVSAILIAFGLAVFWGFSSSKRISYGIISKGPTIERVPRISNSGDRLITAREVGEGINLDIVEYDLINRGFHPITSLVGLETDPIWSPDDKKIAFLQRVNDVVSMFEIDLDNQEHSLLTRADLIPNLSAMDWSPDGSTIAFSSGVHRKWPFILNEIDLETLISKAITHPSEDIIGDVNPRYSPDGNRMAFIRCTNESELYGQFIQAAGDIYILNKESSETSQLTFKNGDITGLDWSEEGKELYFIDVENHFKFQLKSLSIETGDQQIIFESDKLLRNIDIQGKTAALEEWNIEYQIVGYSKKTHRIIDRISSENQKNWMPQLSHSKKKLAYVSTASGFSELWVMDLDTHVKAQLSHFGGPLISHLDWSPEDNQIILSTSQTGTEAVHLVDINNGAISKTEIEGKAIFDETGNFAFSYKGSSSGILKTDLINMASSEVVDIEVTSLGQWNNIIYYSLKGKNGLWSYDLNSGAEKLTLAHLYERDNDNWTVVNDKIYFTGREQNGRSRLYKYDIASERISPFHSNFDGQQSTNFSGITVAQDESMVFITLSGPILSQIRLLEL